MKKARRKLKLSAIFLSIALALGVSAGVSLPHAFGDAFHGAPANHDGLPPAGIELEFSFIGPYGDATHAPDSAYIDILQIFKKRFGGRIHNVEPFTKWNIPNARQAHLIDAQGRKWEAIPEKVNAPPNAHLPIKNYTASRDLYIKWFGHMDGVEVPSPILWSREDFSKVGLAAEEALNSGKYVTGVETSTHITVGAEQLIDFGEMGEVKRGLKFHQLDPAVQKRLKSLSEDERYWEFMQLKGFTNAAEADATKLLKTILYLEAHSPEMIAATSPVRTGSFINRYIIPLAAQQPDLMNELQEALNGPPEGRTYGAIRKIFKKHHERELELRVNDANVAWKYRFYQYKKLFGLGDPDQFAKGQEPKYMSDQTFVIEGRFPEATEDSIEAATQLMRTLIHKAHELYTDKKFKNPYEGLTIQDPFRGLFNRETDLEANRYSHLDELNARILELSRAKYKSFLEALGEKVENFKAFWKIKDFTKFDREYRGRLGLVKADLPHNPNVTYHALIRTEGGLPAPVVGASLPSLNAAVKSHLAHQQGLDAVHTHVEFEIRVPHETFENISRASLSQWLNRIDKYFHAIEINRNSSVTTAQVAELSELTGGGFMIRIHAKGNELDAMDRVAQMIEVGLHAPQAIEGFSSSDDPLVKIGTGAWGLEEVMREHFQDYQKREMTDQELDYLRNVIEKAPALQRIPNPFSLQDHPLFDAFEHTQIADANLQLKLRIWEILNARFGEHLPGLDPHWTAPMGLPNTDTDQLMQYVVDEWGRTAQYGLILESTLFKPYLKASPELGIKLRELQKYHDCQWALLHAGTRGDLKVATP